MKSSIQSIFETIEYFRFFDYAPTFEEIYTFLKKKTFKGQLVSILGKMEKKGIIISRSSNRVSIENFKLKTENCARYTLGEYSTRASTRNSQFPISNLQINRYKDKLRISRLKIAKIQHYIDFLSRFPQIQLIGISGTVSMMNAKESDDIDIFIVTARKRLFTGRFIAILLAKLYGIKRERSNSRNKDKVCLNLFFDKVNVKIPQIKQTEYVAHEVLQMKPLINKNHTYEYFLSQNKWVYKIFPNAKSVFSKQYSVFRKKIGNSKYGILNIMENYVEKAFKKLELISIKLHQTNEKVTDTQLWFFPEDFEKKLN